jgi:hypothetical protein
MSQDIINAFPRKKLFIDILTQDVSVKTCILDLIDNSVDSYVRNKIGDKRSINLLVNETTFQIFDNCGGIDKTRLKDQVFRFGGEITALENATLGMYGIGLKRSIFKLGNEITVETDDGTDFSSITLNVTEWEAEVSWNIPFNSEASKLRPDEKPYTKITVTNLHADIKAKFELSTFKFELLETIKKTYCLLIKDSIDFVFNTSPVEPYPLLVPVEEGYEPSVSITRYDEVDIEIICFIDPSKGARLRDAVNQRGWNLFCNKRLILSNDTTETTGWQGGGDKLPKYHSIYNEFRGIVFLKSNNPFKLPLNTSKSGLNTEEKVYHYILNQMIITARPIIDYLSDKYKKETKEEEELKDKIEKTVDESFKPTLVPATDIIAASTFKAPDITASSQSKTVRISYSKEKTIVENVMKHLEVSTYKEVGEETFNYYVKMEGLDDE